MPQSMKPFRKFSPLQNICLYLEAFGVPGDPLGALQPLDEARIAQALLESQFFGDKIAIQPQVVESWDSYLRTILPIDCVRNGMVSRVRLLDDYGLIENRNCHQLLPRYLTI